MCELSKLDANDFPAELETFFIDFRIELWWGVYTVNTYWLQVQVVKFIAIHTTDTNSSGIQNQSVLITPTTRHKCTTPQTTMQIGLDVRPFSRFLPTYEYSRFWQMTGLSVGLVCGHNSDPTYHSSEKISSVGGIWMFVPCLPFKYSGQPLLWSRAHTHTTTTKQSKAAV